VPRAADRAIALCEYSAGVLHGLGVSPDRVSVIPPAVEDPGSGRTVAEARRALGLAPGTTFATYLILASTARFLVEFVRINPPVLMGLTAAQLTSMALVALGALTLAVGRRWRPAAV
jgi:phosphatidylglycerol:prolipoprotein diacylglycerol transferase